MAVFGILILIVIYLLINAKVSDIEFVEALEEMREEKASLGDSVEKAVAQRNALYENAVKVIESRETLELSKQVEANRTQIEMFDDQISDLLSDVDEETGDLNKIVSERFEGHPAVLNTRREVVEQRVEIEALKGLIASAELDADETEGFIEKTESYMEEIEDQYRVELDDSLAGESVYLVDFSVRQFRAFKVYNGVQSAIEITSAQELLLKVKVDPNKKRVFFFVRPDAIDDFKKSIVSFRQSNIAVGYQPVPEGEKLILTKFPEGIPSVGREVAQDGSGTTSGGPAGSAGVDGSNSTGGGRVVPGETDGGGSGSAAQSEGQASSSEAASDTGGGAGAVSEAGQEQPESADTNADSTVDPAQASEETTVEEASSEYTQTFKWLLLIFAILFLIVLILTIKSSRK